MAKKSGFLDLQKAGQGAYENKRYEEALDFFSKAIISARKWSPSDVLPILDQRVAVHVKLGNLGEARKDAMSMIRSTKSDGRGYLRCGQLDRLEDNPSAALRWYEHGMKQVPKSDRLYESIEAQIVKTKILLDKKLMFSKSKDPVSILPAELVQFVVAYLEYVDIVRALRVSKAWKVTLLRLRPLIDTVDFSKSRKIINYKVMVAALKRLGPTPKTLIMNDLAEPATNLLRMNLERWRNYTQLEELAISSTLFGLGLLPFEKYSLKSLTMKNGRVRDHMIVEIMKACRMLQIARFSNVRGCLSSHHNASWVDPLFCPTIYTLELGGDGSEHYSLAIYPTFFSYCPNLEQLECHDLQVCVTDDPFDLSVHSSLHKLSFSSCRIPWWPKLPPKIEVWDNSETRSFHGHHGRNEKLGELAKLRFLRFNKTFGPPQAHSFLPETPSQSITHLDSRGTSVSGYDGPNFELARAIRDGHLVNLRELAMGGVDEDSSFIQALKELGKLEVLLFTSSKISGSLLIDIFKNCRNNLRQITLIDCLDVPADTINWLRLQGITMHVKSESGQSFGRRLNS